MQRAIERECAAVEQTVDKLFNQRASLKQQMRIAIMDAHARPSSRPAAGQGRQSRRCCAVRGFGRASAKPVQEQPWSAAKRKKCGANLLNQSERRQFIQLMAKLHHYLHVVSRASDRLGFAQAETVALLPAD